jgi:hypothetical protein
LQAAARWPRAGWATMGSVSSDTQLNVTSSTTIPYSDLTGGMFRYRANYYVYNKFKVLNQTGQTLRIDSGSNPQFGPVASRGYYVDQHPALVQEPLDWAFDSDTNYLYFYAPTGFDLSRVTVTQFEFAFRSINHHTFGFFFEDLVFSHYTNAAIHLRPNINGLEERVVKVNNCEFRELLGLGIELIGGNGGTSVSNSMFDTLYTGAIHVSSIPTTLTIQKNRFSKVGSLLGYGGTASEIALHGLVLRLAKDAVVKENVFEEMGAVVISGVSADGVLIEDNNFYDTQKYTADAGVVHPWGFNQHETKNWTIRRNTFCKGNSNTDGLESSATPLNAYVYLDRYTTSPVVTENIMIGSETLPYLILSTPGGLHHRVSKNLLIGKNKDRLIMLSDDLPYNDGLDIQHFENRVFQLDPEGSIYHIRGKTTNSNYYHLFDNTYYHYGTKHNQTSNILVERDLSGYAIDYSQESGSKSYSSLMTCQGVGQPQLLHDYEFPQDKNSFQTNSALTTFDQGTYLELKVPPLSEGSYYPSTWFDVASGLPTYKVVYDFETDPTVPGHVKIMETRKTTSDVVQYPVKWFGAYFSRESFFHLMTFKAAEAIAQFRPWLNITNVSETEDYVAKLYGVQIFEYPASCERDTWDDLAVVTNPTSASRSVVLHEPYLDESFNTVEDFVLPAHSYKLLFKNYLNSQRLIQIP